MKSSQKKSAQSNFITLVVALFLLCGLNKFCDAQTTIRECSRTLRDTVPTMWVPCDEGKGYEDNYVGLQYKQLSDYLIANNLGKEEAKSVFLPIAGFQKMLEYFESLKNFNYLHVYIASYGDAKSKSVPPGQENKLTILFAPGTGEFTHDALGYTLTASGDFDPKSNDCVININEDPLWLNLYYNKMNAKLLPNLPKDDDNTNLGLVTDTKIISYKHQDICQLFNEFYYQEKKDIKNTVTGLMAVFSSFPAGGRLCNGRFKNRIFVIFEFTRDENGKNEIFYIDKQTGFGQRVKPIPCSQPFYGVDNGHLCPPC